MSITWWARTHSSGSLSITRLYFPSLTLWLNYTNRKETSEVQCAIRRRNRMMTDKKLTFPSLLPTSRITVKSSPGFFFIVGNFETNSLQSFMRGQLLYTHCYSLISVRILLTNSGQRTKNDRPPRWCKCTDLNLVFSWPVTQVILHAVLNLDERGVCTVITVVYSDPSTRCMEQMPTSQEGWWLQLNVPNRPITKKETAHFLCTKRFPKS